MQSEHVQLPRNVHFCPPPADCGAGCDAGLDAGTGTGDGADGRRAARTDSGASETGSAFLGALHPRFIDDLMGVGSTTGSGFDGRDHPRFTTGVDVTSTGAGAAGCVSISPSLSLVSPIVRNGSARLAGASSSLFRIAVTPKLSLRFILRCFSVSMSLSSGLGAALDAISVIELRRDMTTVMAGLGSTGTNTGSSGSGTGSVSGSGSGSSETGEAGVAGLLGVRGLMGGTNWPFGTTC